MGKQAETKVLAGAEGTGIDSAPALKLVTSPKRQIILDGMLEAAGAEGYEHTSVRTVLDRTGVYRQAFYDNFADKDDCYLQSFEAGVERLEALALKAAARETTCITSTTPAMSCSKVPGKAPPTASSPASTTRSRPACRSSC